MVALTGPGMHCLQAGVQDMCQTSCPTYTQGYEPAAGTPHWVQRWGNPWEMQHHKLVKIALRYAQTMQRQAYAASKVCW